MTKSDKILLIQKEIADWHPVTLEDILIRVKKNNLFDKFLCLDWKWTILLFTNWQWVAMIERLLWKPLSEQSEDTINALADLILLVKGDD